ARARGGRILGGRGGEGVPGARGAGGAGSRCEVPTSCCWPGRLAGGARCRATTRCSPLSVTVPCRSTASPTRSIGSSTGAHGRPLVCDGLFHGESFTGRPAVGNP